MCFNNKKLAALPSAMVFIVVTNAGLPGCDFGVKPGKLSAGRSGSSATSQGRSFDSVVESSRFV